MTRRFFSIFIFQSYVFAQPSVWTVSFFHGERDTIISLQHCRLISVSSDSLKIQTDSSEREVPIYLLKELSRPTPGGFHFMPVVIGSALGLSLGLCLSGSNDRTQNVGEPSATTTTMYAILGGGIGLMKSVDEETTRYKLPFGLSNPEKRKIIENIRASVHT